MQFERDGKLREAFDAYLVAFQTTPIDSAKSGELRIKIISLALKINPPPDIPEEAKKRVVFAMTALEEQSASGDKDATEEFAKAAQIAPWWPLAYYNLGLLHEKQGNLKAAVANLQFYLATAPDASDAAAVKTQLYKLEYKLQKIEQLERPERLFEATPSRTIADLGLDMIYIKSGTFSMGSGSGGEADERPVTEVTFTRGFRLAACRT